MTDILLYGCCGKMGRVIAGMVKERNDCRIVAGVDIRGEVYAGFPVYTALSQVREKADVLIDFSHPSSLSPILQYANETAEIALVLCTSGYSEEQVASIHAAAEKLPVFYSRNMSLGINLLIALCKQAQAVLGEAFDIEIVEKHHNQKIDAPSGTALMLADAIKEQRECRTQYVYDRHSQRKKREQNEIGIHSIRGGTIVGEHEVIFAGNHETITLTHTAQSKEVFAAGAVNAACFMAKKPYGLYTMSDMIAAVRES